MSGLGIWGLPISVATIQTNGRDNDKSTQDTINQMIRLARHSSSLPVVNAALDSCLSKISAIHTSSPSNREIARRIFWFVKSHLTFETDEAILQSQFNLSEEEANDRELIISPEMLLSMSHPMGDCDCYSTLTASLVVCAKMPCAYVVIAVDEKEPFRWSHVFCKAYLQDEGQWLTMDTSHGMYPGWETGKFQFRRMEWIV